MGVVRLIGEHISYSASPRMQAAAFAAFGVDHRYELADVGADDLAGGWSTALRDGDCLGANVTVPHKQAVIPLLDEVEPLAQRAGAVNTIVVRDGRLVGSNTDIPAIVDEVRRLAGAPRRAVILGAGGAARAVGLALDEIGSMDVAMVSRANWTELPALLADADLVVNATPIGTNSDETPVDQRLLHPGLAVLDLVYRPSPTRLVREARECGLAAAAGAGVLFGQGWRSLEAWLATPLDVSVKVAMAAALRAELGDQADV